MRFTCCLNMAFNLKKPIWALICLHDLIRESVAALTDHFADAFVRENVLHVYDVVGTFRKINCKKRDILMFKRCFQCGLG